MKFKQCKKCLKIKSINAFYPRKTSIDGLRSWCKDCCKIEVTLYYQRRPWKRTFMNIRDRCSNINHRCYKNYGGRGIKCQITTDEIKKLWFRDEAYLMKRPSIDRIDNNGNYEYNNCRFIECNFNSVRSHKKPILQFDLTDKFIREWDSAVDAGKSLNIRSTHLSTCAREERKTAYGFKWQYKNQI